MDSALCLLSDVCRLCLNLNGTHNIANTDNLLQDICLFLGIQISSDDKFPQSICTNCLYKIEAIKDLKDCATSNDTYMKSLLNTDTEIRHEVALPKTKNGLMNQLPIEKPKISVKSVIDINSDGVAEQGSLKTVKRSQSISTDSKEFVNKHHICDVCHKTYPTRKKLYLHKRSHSKKLCCPLDACGKRFATKGDLQRHIRAHTGERPYACAHCGAAFSQRGSLRTHARALHAAPEPH